MLCLLLSSPALAATETFPTEKDTAVWLLLPNTNFGHLNRVEVGRHIGKESSATAKRGLLHFAVGTLPAEAVISNATLRLYVQHIDGDDPLGLELAVWRLSADFVEGNGSNGVTWNTQPGVEASPSALATMDTPVGDWFEMDVATVVEADIRRVDAPPTRFPSGTLPGTDESLQSVDGSRLESGWRFEYDSRPLS